MAIMVTGGAGFIGSHLCEFLLNCNQEVVAIDDLSTGSMSNIDHLSDYSSFRFKEGSINDESLMKSVIEKCDIIYHLAASVGVKLIVDKPLEAMENNVFGTENVLKYALKDKKKVLITSSSEVYGRNNSVPFSENDDRVFGSVYSTRWGYALSKSMDEFLAINYYTEKHLPTVVSRLFNTVGPRQTGQYGMVVPRLVEQAINSEPLTVYGDGNQSRCFTHVEDVVKGLVGLMESSKTVGEVFNIGSDDEITIHELAEKIIYLTGSTSTIQFVSYDQVYGKRFEDMQRRVPDISRIKKVIGFEPKVGIDKIIKDVVDYFRKNKY